MLVDTPKALVDVACRRRRATDVVREISYDQLAQLLEPKFSVRHTHRTEVLARGRARRHGDAVGVLALDPATADRLASQHTPYIYALDGGDTGHFPAIKYCAGFFTPNPAPTAFAAVQAVSEDHPTLIGVDCRIITRDGARRVTFRDGTTIDEGTRVSLSGHDGALYPGELPLEDNDIARLHELVLTIARSAVESGQCATQAEALARLPRCPTYRDHEPELAALAGRPLVQGFEQVKQAAHAEAPLTVATTAHTADGVARARLLSGRITTSPPYVIPEPVTVGLLRDERMWCDPSDRELLRLVFLGEPVLGSPRYREIRDRYLDEHTRRIHAVLAAAGDSTVVARTPCMPFDKIFPHEVEPTDFAHRHHLDPHQVGAALEARGGENEIYAGNRGMRVFCQHPDIAELWLRAVLTAARQVRQRGHPVRLRLLLATITLPAEAEHFLRLFDRVAADVLGEHIRPVVDGISIMVETTGAYLALEDFLNTTSRHGRIDGGMVGSNDFTAACLNFHREDAPRTITPGYVHSGLLTHSPFERLDTAVVGPAILTALKRARWAAHDASRQLWGFGGELAGDWETVQWLACHAQPLGLDYITTAPRNMLPALIAAAQARLAQTGLQRAA